jgi:ferric-dicitrate binding protein FerR (iron transport regulator)
MENNNQHIDPVALLPKYFAGEATDEERRHVDEWLTADSSHAEEFDAILKLWNLTGKVSEKEDIDIDREWQKLESALHIKKSKVVSFSGVLQIAASVILVSTLAFWGIQISRIKIEKAPAAEISVIKLPDGSLVSLNAGSKISYYKGFGLTHRNINLKGEAFFEVSKNNQLPFQVYTGQAIVKVVGTKFNIKAYKDKPLIKITVTEGTVLLYNTSQPEKAAKLNAGETGTYDKKLMTISKQPVVNKNDIAWKTKILDFNNSPLIEVIEILENTYHYSIIAEPRVQNCAITVRFENQRFDSVIKVLRETLDLSVSYRGKQIVISGKGC